VRIQRLADPLHGGLGARDARGRGCYYMLANMPMSAANLGTEDARIIDIFMLPPGASTFVALEPGWSNWPEPPLHRRVADLAVIKHFRAQSYSAWPYGAQARIAAAGMTVLPARPHEFTPPA
jgi:hypothetical protein